MFKHLGMKTCRIICILLSLQFIASTAYSQVQANTGSIAGHVLDSSGAGIPHASIVVTNTQTGVVTPTSSSATGSYQVSTLIPGTYTVRASAPDFQSQLQTHILVEINSTAAVTLRLTPGSAATTVTVEASNMGIQTESSDLTTVVTPRLVSDLPVTNTATQQGVRTPISLLFLTPGTTGGIGDNLNQNMIAGGQQEGAEILLDGDSIDVISGGSYNAPGITPSLDAVSEFSVLTAGIPAEYGRTSGGVVNFATKSGTNEFHGAVYDIIRNTAFDANTWFNNHYAAARCVGSNDTAACHANYATPQDKKNDYGVFLGGPVWIPHVYNGHNRTFFFFSWEQVPQNHGGLAVGTVPTLANRNGDFSANLVSTNILVAHNPCDNNNPIYQGEIFDPSSTQNIGGVICRTPFRSGGQLNVMPPGTTFSQVAQNILSYLPQPTTSSATNNYNYPWSYPVTTTLETIRIDHAFGPNDKIFGSYNVNDFSGNNGTPNMPGPGANYATQSVLSHTETFGYDHVFSPSLENHLNIGGFRQANLLMGVAATYGGDFGQKLGLPTLSTPTFPVVAITNYTGLGNNQGTNTVQNHVNINDSLMWIKGKHTVKVGFDLRNFQWSVATYNLTSTLSFAQAETAGISTSTTQDGNAFASFLLGQMSTASASHVLHSPRFIEWYQAVFAEDAYKVSPALSLTLGLRYSVDAPRFEAANDSSIFSPEAINPGADGLRGALIFAGRGAGRSGLSSSFVSTAYGDIAPRIGFAWSPNSARQSMAVRGSYGIVYAAFPAGAEGTKTQAGFTASASHSQSNSLGGFSGVGFTLDDGFPALATSVNYDPSQLNGQATVYSQRDGKPAMIQLWNLQVQQSLAPDLTFTMGYVGNHATRLSSDLRNINALPSAYWSMGSKLNAAVKGNPYGIAVPYSSFSGTIANALRPYPQYLHIAPAVETAGQSSYNALWATLQRRYKNGLTLLAAFTWAKTMTNADWFLPTLFESNAAQNPFDPRSERSLAAQDIPNSLSLSYVYELPFGRGKAFLNRSGVFDAALGGWRIGGIQSYNSSTPISFGCANSIPGTNNCVRWNHSGTNYLSALAHSSHFNPDTDNYFLNSGQSYQQLWKDPESGVSSGGGYQLGNVTRETTARGTFQLGENFSLMKEIQFERGAHLELRGDFFNAFNRHQFAVPVSNPTSPSFGIVASNTYGPRQLQLICRLRF